MTYWDGLVIGGGFFGCMVAARLRRRLPRVLLIEKETDLLLRASYVNQARVHNGYHYPRSLLTALRSRENFDRFVRDYADCVVSDFHKVYAIARRFSKVTADQFHLFCRRIGAPIDPAPSPVRRLFDPNTVEDVFLVREFAFDAVKLRTRVRQELAAAGVEVWYDTRLDRVAGLPGGTVWAGGTGRRGPFEVTAGVVFNCTYSEVNRVLTRSGLPVIPLKHELTEMALVRVPDELQRIGVTVMCGPFFSLMPFPPAGLHTLSHVRYTPHAGWVEDRPDLTSPHDVFAAYPKESNVERMRRDATRYLPAAGRVEYVRSLWEVKTVLPVNEADDGRPILFQTDVGIPNLHCVLGAKIDNIYDALGRVDDLLDGQREVA